MTWKEEKGGTPGLCPRAMEVPVPGWGWSGPEPGARTEPGPPGGGTVSAGSGARGTGIGSGSAARSTVPCALSPPSPNRLTAEDAVAVPRPTWGEFLGASGRGGPREGPAGTSGARGAEALGLGLYQRGGPRGSGSQRAPRRPPPRCLRRPVVFLRSWAPGGAPCGRSMAALRGGPSPRGYERASPSVPEKLRSREWGHLPGTPVFPPGAEPAHVLSPCPCLGGPPAKGGRGVAPARGAEGRAGPKVGAAEPGMGAAGA